jgi:hypothetical protein
MRPRTCSTPCVWELRSREAISGEDLADALGRSPGISGRHP